MKKCWLYLFHRNLQEATKSTVHVLCNLRKSKNSTENRRALATYCRATDRLIRGHHYEFFNPCNPDTPISVLLSEGEERLVCGI